jgi:hypothetical protein
MKKAAPAKSRNNSAKVMSGHHRHFHCAHQFSGRPRNSSWRRLISVSRSGLFMSGPTALQVRVALEAARSSRHPSDRSFPSASRAARAISIFISSNANNRSASALTHLSGLNDLTCFLDCNDFGGVHHFALLGLIARDSIAAAVSVNSMCQPFAITRRRDRSRAEIRIAIVAPAFRSARSVRIVGSTMMRSAIAFMLI